MTSKTETQTAEENIKEWGFFKPIPIDKLLDKQDQVVFRWIQGKYESKIKTHKATCQRWLEFLEEEMERWNKVNEFSEIYISTGELEEKITDLKQAIKLYDKAGI